MTDHDNLRNRIGQIIEDKTYAMAPDFEEIESENAKQLARILDRHMDEDRGCYGGSASPEFIAGWLDAHGVTAPGCNDD